MDFNEQIQAYTAWVNSQLKKRSQHIDSLSQDLKDGLALISVVEIVSGKPLESLDTKNNPENKRKNIQTVLDFMKNNGIRLQHVSLEDLLEGDTKSLMQLILALAAHFKPASIGSRRTSYDSTSSASSQARMKNAYRWKNRLRNKTGHDSAEENIERAIRVEIDEDMGHIKEMTEKLQKFLLNEVEAQPVEIQGNLMEENVILQARIDQSSIDIEKLKDELRDSRLECRKVRSDSTAVDLRCKEKERELLSLRQQLLRRNLAHDKLETEKAEMTLEMEKLHDEVDNLRSQLREKERELDQSKHDVELIKTDYSRTISRKDKEINQLKVNLSTADILAPSRGEVYNGNTPRLSPVSLQSSLNSSGLIPLSPKIVRTTPLSKNHPPRRRRQSELVETRILYFIDREMTPAMTSIPKRVGDITLAEFKKATRRENGSFRFVFKALDPELGTVKEEIFNDEDIVPGWEGKIVAWIEEVVRV